LSQHDVAGPVTVSAAGTGWPAELGTPARGAGLGGAAALALIGTSVAAFAVVMALGPSATVPRIGTGAPLFWWPAHPSAALVSALERLGVLAGALGTAIGLAAIRRGWRPSAWLLPGAGVLAAGLFVVLPPAGSTDVLSYACYGRIASLGHSPYLVTPAQLYRASDPVGILGPAAWRTLPSVYGPVATVVQWAAAELGGGSMARIVFWIRLGNALAFLATAVALLRLVGQDPVRRIRVCLLWTANPLMLFWLIGSGHLDVLIALLTVAALLAIRRPGTTGGLVGGILAGAAIGIKLPFAFVGAGLAWQVRDSRRKVTAVVCAALATAGVAYLFPGAAQVSALRRRLSAGTSFLFYLPHTVEARPVLLTTLVLAATLVVAALLAWRLPPDHPGTPGVRLMLALAIASLAVLPVQQPWYDALIFVLLAAIPASGLDYLLIARCLLLSQLVLPGAAGDNGMLTKLAGQVSHAGLLFVLAVLIVGSLRGVWRGQPVTG